MRYIVFSAKRMGNGVDISYIGFGKCTSGIERSVEHIATRFHITAVIVGGIDIFKNQLYSQ